MDGDRKTETPTHTRRIRSDRCVDESAEITEADDIVEALVDCLTTQAEDRAVEVNVLPPAEKRVEAYPEAEEAANLAVHRDTSAIRPENTGKSLQKCGLPGAVGADDSNHVTGTGDDVDPTKCPIVLAPLVSVGSVLPEPGEQADERSPESHFLAVIANQEPDPQVVRQD